MLLTLLAAAPAFAELSLSPLFSEGVVLQAGRPIVVWGTDAAGETVSVALGEATGKTACGDDGRWEIRLPAMAATRGGETLTLNVASTSQKGLVSIKDVAVGEVWLCFGDGHMQARVADRGGELDLGGADVRVFDVPFVVAGKPQNRLPGGAWQKVSAATLTERSLLAMSFALRLHEHHGDVPIGLIVADVRGTTADAWVSRATLLGSDELKGKVVYWDQWIASYGEQIDAFQQQITEWRDAARRAEAKGDAVPPPPGIRLARDPRSHEQRPSGLYNGMIAPMSRFAIRGGFAHVGEVNRGRGWQFRKLLPALFADFRAVFGDDDLPFVIVQAGASGKKQAAFAPSALAELRESQAIACRDEHARLVVTAHLDNSYAALQTTGQLAASNALALSDATDAPPTHVRFKSMSVEDDTVTLTVTPSDGDAAWTIAPGGPTGFVVAGEDRKFFEAEAAVVDGTIVVSSVNVPRPVAVRYGWADWPYMPAWLGERPLAPFRTDDWPGVTDKAR